MKYVNWILVPIDFSEESRLALEAADCQAEIWRTGLILMHVRKPHEPARSRLTFEEGALERWGRFIEHTPPDQVAFINCTGDPADEILRIAEQYRPRKIVMGRGGDKRQPGSIARAVGKGYPGIVEAIAANRDDVFIHAQIA